MQANTYAGGCHCGKVRYEVTTALDEVISCNCSICSKKGWLLTFVGEHDFKLLSGADSLEGYRFNKHVVDHLFCTECGIGSFSAGARPDGSKSYAVNVRCLDDVDVSTLTVKSFDGRSL